ADQRTNSIIAAGAPSDLLRILAIITRLEDAPESQQRKNEVFHLKNATATDVATSLQNFWQATLDVLNTSQILTPYTTLERDVVVVAEPVSNKLLISATPKYFDEVMRLVAELDAEQPMVVIQVLVAEVDLNGSEEFGIEVGLQAPVLFNRSVL